MIVDRERERDEFVPVEYWTIDGDFARQLQNGSKRIVFKAGLHAIKGKKKIEIPDGERANEIVADLEGASYVVDSVRKRETRSRPAPPFITSTLQQEASRKLRFTARRTMQIAQQLYEGLPLGNDEPEGLITYMRTDSTNVAASALAEANAHIKAKFGEEYAPKEPRVYTRKVKGAQEAHEAIRPTSIARDPQSIRRHLNSEQFRLYDLIWKRMVASQMNDAIFDSTTVEIIGNSRKSSTQYVFRARGSILKFAGFRILYMEGTDDSSGDDENDVQLPELAKDDGLDCLKINSDQHFTQPPPRYNEASLIKALEELGIGRPSTYAPIMATIMNRDYVRKEEGGRFIPSKLGIAVTGLLTTHFPDVMDTGFTARVEENLDNIANGELKWTPMLKEFYGPFAEAIEKAMKEAERVPRDQIDEETDEVCEVCGRPMVIKSGRFGRFLSCSGFPDCKASRPLLERVGVDCPECGSDLVERRQRGKGGRKFYGCSNYPTCSFAVNARPLPLSCPECSKMLVASGRSNARCPECQWKGPIPEPEGELMEVAD
jgi:DNA topoisomerase-1